MDKINLKKIAVILIIPVLILGAIFIFRDKIFNFPYSFPTNLVDFRNKIGELTQEAQRKVYTPDPLVVEEEAPDSFLTNRGVVEATNTERQSNGLPSLQQSSKLTQSARTKAEDMIANQYFQHTSPAGKGIADLALEVGYDYIAIGENLALGGFKNNQSLIDAWMASPGHRANILNPSFTEIGVFVIKANYKGRNTWFAVQHFGVPSSVCSKPNQNIKSQIQNNQVELDSLEEEMNSLKAQIRSIRPKRGKQYVEKVEQYNNLVVEYNKLANQTEQLINQYNSQVKEFNDCLQLYN